MLNAEEKWTLKQLYQTYVYKKLKNVSLCHEKLKLNKIKETIEEWSKFCKKKLNK